MRALLSSLPLMALFVLGPCSAYADSHDSPQTAKPNQAAPIYRVKPLLFPARGSAHCVGGDLAEADYIHRSGLFRREDNGELVSFHLPPYGSVCRANTEADLRDIPLGTHLFFYLCPDPASGDYSQAVLIRDTFTETASNGLIYSLDSIQPDPQSKTANRLLLSRHNTAPVGSATQPERAISEIRVDADTHVWKGSRSSSIPIADLKVGDALLFNYSGGTTHSSPRCTDIWVGTEAQGAATTMQRKRQVALLKERGLPAWVDSTHGDEVVVTLFSAEPAFLQALFKQEGIDLARWEKERRNISVAVANQHLRTYLPNVTNKWATVQSFETVPSNGFGYGCGGVRLVLKPELMLEGYRRGHVVRLFAQSWPVEAMPFGEGLYSGGHDEEPPDSKELQTADFPYRTDFGNEDLPWYRLQPDQFPPDHSEHRVGGALVKIDTAQHRGQFRTDCTGELVDFTMPRVGKVWYLNTAASLDEIPTGTHCLFSLYLDEKGVFTRAVEVMDDYSNLANGTLTYRFEAVQPGTGRLVVARHAAPVKVDYVLEPRVPVDSGRLELEVDASTRIWKGERQISLRDLVAGDELLVNLGLCTKTSKGRCTDIWVGAETHQITTEQQRKRHAGHGSVNVLKH